MPVMKKNKKQWIESGPEMTQVIELDKDVKTAVEIRAIHSQKSRKA